MFAPYQPQPQRPVTGNRRGRKGTGNEIGPGRDKSKDDGDDDDDGGDDDDC